MVDWSAVFDEAYPEAGASADTLAQFATSFGSPLSKFEAKTIKAGQQNPFPTHDPLHATYRSFDPALWNLPNGPLPKAYLDFLKWSNGGEFRTGRRWFQFFPVMDPSHGVRAMLLAYHLPQYMPGALPIASNGGGTFYLFDMRQSPPYGEYSVVGAHSGSLGWQADKCIQVADSFLTACRDPRDIDELR